MALLIGFLLSLFLFPSSYAGIRLVEFKNESELHFNPTFCNGMPVEGALLDHNTYCLATEDDQFELLFEDAGQSGYYHPEWKFHIWLAKEGGVPFLGPQPILYAVIFYDGVGEISIHWDQKGTLAIRGGAGIKDILYPWAKGAIGRSNPYHEIQGVEGDENGIKYYDYNGFVGYLEAN